MKKLVAFFTLLFCFGCSKEINSDITSFNFGRDFGLGGYYHYQIRVEDDKVIFTKEAIGMTTENIEKEITKKDLKEIQKIINEQEIYKWNGFDKTDENVLDGSGFTLSVNYSNGENIEAHGYMRYPKNFKEASDVLLEYLETLEK